MVPIQFCVRKMFPAFSRSGTGDGAFVEVKKQDQVVKRDAFTAQKSNCQNVSVREFALRVPLAAYVSITSFRHHVALIVSARTNKKMGGVAARRIIAGVADDKSVRKFCTAELCSDATSMSHVAAELAVSFPITRSHPRPARRRTTASIDFCPKSILVFNRRLWSFRRMSATSATRKTTEMRACSATVKEFSSGRLFNPALFALEERDQCKRVFYAQLATRMIPTGTTCCVKSFSRTVKVFATGGKELTAPDTLFRLVYRRQLLGLQAGSIRPRSCGSDAGPSFVEYTMPVTLC